LAAYGALASGVLAWADSPPAPSYWNQRVFFIPFQADAATRESRLVKVQLLVSHNGIGDWTVLQTAEPNVRGFSFNAPADGQYDFAVRTVDRRENPRPGQVVRPQLRVVVDAERPILKLEAEIDPAGRLAVRYEASDAHLRGDSLRLEVRTGPTWQVVDPGVPEVRQSDRLLGRWVAPEAAPHGDLSVRAVIADLAGNRTAAETKTSRDAGYRFNESQAIEPSPPMDEQPEVAGPTPSLAPATGSLTFPEAGNDAGEGPAISDPFTGRPVGPLRTSPPAGNPPAATPEDEPVAARPAATPARLVADTGSADAPPLLDGRSLLTGGEPADSSSSLGPGSNLSPETSPVTPDVRGGSSWQAAAPPAPATQVRWVNSLAFDVDYDLESVGPWGVASVELWITRDGGRSWIRYGADPDNRGPMRVEAPAAGVYGFRIVVNGANGAAGATPRPGDAPELSVGVDLEPPQAALGRVEMGRGSLANHLLIRWTAADERLEPRPISLSFGPQSEGPWTTIATDLANVGEYAWQLPREAPGKVFVRIDVRDVAGNVTSRRTPAAVELTLPQPTGRIRNIRPVAESKDRYRTARGAK
jgi:hypothetical protein